jgi:hypothetical protein
MALSGKERQASFRARMKQEGRQYLPLWVTHEQALQIRAMLNESAPPTEQPTEPQPPKLPTPSSVKSQAPPAKFVMPKIPPRTPAPIVRDLMAANTLYRKKQAQVDKLETSMKGLAQWISQTVKDCQRI